MNDLKQKYKNNPWLLILIATPLPLLALGFFLFKYSTSRLDFTKLNQQMIERQNRVLANDAISVAAELSYILNEAGRDIETLAMLPVKDSVALEFHRIHNGQVTITESRDDSVVTLTVPLYNQVSIFDLKGNEKIRIQSGALSPLRKLGECSGLNFCDRKALESILYSAPGTLQYGHLQRWYAKDGETEDLTDAHLPLYYRALDRVVVLGIDYRYFRHIMTLPTFPYERKRDLLHSYQNGNYIYLVDDEFNLIVHPKISHVTGLDRQTGERVAPFTLDSEEGTRPLNFSKYQGEKLRDYFTRLLTRSFQAKSVDVFQANNLGGTKRVLSVAPTLLNRGQFTETGVFGHTVLGCNVDYFEEPRERYVPYY